MNRNILVALDGSPLAETVLPHAVALAQATNRGLTLLRVVAAPADPERLLQSEERIRSRIYLAELADRLRAMGVGVQMTVLEGDPAQRIIAQAGDYAGSGMLAMATHARTGPRRWVYGSVAEEVLHAAPAPLLLLRAQAQAQPVLHPVAYRKLLVPLDGSAFSAQALGEARRLAKASGAALYLLSVVDGLGDVVSSEDAAAAEGRIASAWMLADAHAQTEQIATMLDHTAKQLRAEGLMVQTALGHGRPAEEILRVTAETDADLVVMATHGRTALQRFLVGSVALEVLKGTERPVLLVRPYAHAKLKQLSPAWGGMAARSHRDRVLDGA